MHIIFFFIGNILGFTPINIKVAQNIHLAIVINCGSHINIALNTECA